MFLKFQKPPYYLYCGYDISVTQMVHCSSFSIFLSNLVRIFNVCITLPWIIPNLIDCNDFSLWLCIFLIMNIAVHQVLISYCSYTNTLGKYLFNSLAPPFILVLSCDKAHDQKQHGKESGLLPLVVHQWGKSEQELKAKTWSQDLKMKPEILFKGLLPVACSGCSYLPRVVPPHRAVPSSILMPIRFDNTPIW